MGPYATMETFWCPWVPGGAVILAPLPGSKMALPGVELDMKEWLHFWSQNGSTLAVCALTHCREI